MRDILPNFFAKAIQLFNMRDPTAALAEPALLRRALDAIFDTSQKALLADCLDSSGTSSSTLLLNLTPHERAVLLTQSLAGGLLFLHRLADSQWPYDAFLAPYTLTPGTIARQLDEVRRGREGREALETVEASPVFTTCTLRKGVADLLVRAVERADAVRDSDGSGGGGGGHHYHHHGVPRALIVEDDSELQEISMSFVNDKGPDDMVLPCGLTILPLT
jgi:hypothetical protein